MDKKILYGLSVVVILLAGVTLWLGLGGRLLPTREAAVTVYAPNDTQIIVTNVPGENEEMDEPREYRVSDGRLALDLRAGEYAIFATRGEEYHPWMKQITVFDDYPTELRPFFFRATANLETVTDAEIVNAFATTPPFPTADEPHKNADDTMRLYMLDGVLYTEWVGDIVHAPEFFCSGPNVEDCRLQPIYGAPFEASPLEHVAFFGEHSELVLADIGATIIALEIDRRGTQNAQPIYTDTGPVAFRVIDGNIYLSVGGVVSRILLD
jgi:hypothetical protein